MRRLNHLGEIISVSHFEIQEGHSSSSLHGGCRVKQATMILAIKIKMAKTILLKVGPLCRRANAESKPKALTAPAKPSCVCVCVIDVNCVHYRRTCAESTIIPRNHTTMMSLPLLGGFLDLPTYLLIYLLTYLLT